MGCRRGNCLPCSSPFGEEFIVSAETECVKYGAELAIVLERPPKIEMVEAASPVCFELAKRLNKAPRLIAQEIANGLGEFKGIARAEVAGGGYLNAYFDRGAFWEALGQGEGRKADSHD